MQSGGVNMSGAGKIVVSAAIGGTTEALGGGKFANGAVTGAYVMMLNHLGEHGRAKAQEKIASKAMQLYAALLHEMPGPFKGAVAIYCDAGAMLVGSERDVGGVLILAGSDVGKIYGYDELAGGFSTDGSVGGEFGRIDFFGDNVQNFKASMLDGEYYKGWVSVGQGLSGGIGVSFSFPDKSTTIVATSFQIGFGGTPFIIPVSGGYQQGKFNLWNN